MDPKLLRMYSDILNERGPYRPDRSTSQQAPADQGPGLWDRFKQGISGLTGPGPAPGSARSLSDKRVASTVPTDASALNKSSSYYSGSTKAGTPPSPSPTTASSSYTGAPTTPAKTSTATANKGQSGTRTATTRTATSKPPTSGSSAMPVAAQTTPGGGPTDAASLARAQGKEVPAAEPVASTTPDQMRTTTAVKSQDIGFTGSEPAAQTATGQSSYTSPTGVALGAEKPEEPGSGASGYTSLAGAAMGAQGQSAMPSSQGPAVTSGSGAPITTGSGGTLRSRSADEIAKAKPGMSGFFEEESKLEVDESLEEQLEEAFNDMLRLSGLEKKNLEEAKLVSEKAVSKQQQKFMGMVHAMQKGEKVKGASPELKKVAKTMGKKDAKDFAATKHKGLPQKVDESFKLMLDEEGHTLEHIVNRFKHEVKAFLSGDYMAENLYDALYDYYLDRGEMPYGVAKAREGDPYTWVSARFEADIDGTVDVKVPLGEVGHDDTLNELARLAGLSESRVDECGDMGMDQRDTINVSTNMSSDGNKSVNISAQGEKAEELLSMLKLAGMDGQSMNKPAIVAISSDEEMMDEERETEYSNTPEEEYQSVASITRQGNDLNREKKQFANMPKAGDNPMATDYMLDEELSALLDSVLVKEAEPRRPKGDTGQAEIFTADLGIQPPSPDEGPVGKSPIAPKAPATPKAPVVTPGIKR